MNSQANHRPWAIPASRWAVAMRWHDLLFAHWVLPERIRPLLPPGLELDLFAGETWIGVVPFRMTGVRRRGLPAFPGISAFPELNVRTYVTAGGKPGVWFFSLDAASRLAVETARRWFHLPYFHSRMRCDPEGDWLRYESRRTDLRAKNAVFRAAYQPIGPDFLAARGTLEHWLTERYCLYAWDGTRVLRAEIHHAPWPLQPAEADIEVNTMGEAAGIALPNSPPLLHFARRLDVVAWPPAPA
jgi:uncharacterized protein YqjF (DUF2071 family)